MVIHNEATGQTEIQYWVAMRSPQKVRECLERGDDVNALDHDGDGALRYAIQTRSIGLFKLLLEAGADPNAPSSTLSGLRGMHIAHAAAQLGWTDALELLHQHGAELFRQGEKGVTVISLAAAGGHLDTVKWLISKGANPYVEDAIRANALTYAVSEGKAYVVDYLLNYGLSARNERISDTLTDLGLATLRWRSDEHENVEQAKAAFRAVIGSLLAWGADARVMYNMGVGVEITGMLPGHPSATLMTHCDDAREAVLTPGQQWGLFHISPGEVARLTDPAKPSGA